MTLFNKSPEDLLEEELEIDLDHFEEPVKPAGTVANIVAVAIPLLLGAYGIYGSLGLGLGSFDRPGPGLWPLMVSVVMTGLSIALLLMGKKYYDVESISKSAFFRVGLGVLVLVAYLVLFPLMGFEIATVLVVFVWLKYLNGESWLLSISFSLGLTAVLYVLFIVLFKVPLPRII